MSSSGFKRDRTSFDEPRYQFRFYCRDCGHEWKRTIATATPTEIRTPPCPHCKKRQKERNGIKEVLESGQAPAMVGNSVANKAMDMTAEMVMQDYGMTDIKTPTEIRSGESQAPKLPAHMQRAADAMFNPRRALDAVGLGKVAPLIARSALAGSFSAKATGTVDPIAATQAGARHADLMQRTTMINEKKE